MRFGVGWARRWRPAQQLPRSRRPVVPARAEVQQHRNQCRCLSVIGRLRYCGLSPMHRGGAWPREERVGVVMRFYSTARGMGGWRC